MFNKSYLKIFLLWYNMEKYERTIHWKHGNILRGMCDENWLEKSTDTQSEYVECNPFPNQLNKIWQND